MLNLFNVDYIRVNKMINEFVSNVELTGDTNFECIFSSAKFKHERQVFKVAVGDSFFALKVDYSGANSGRLSSEFGVLIDLYEHFSKYEKQTIPKPIYMSENGQFFVVEFVDHPTAKEALTKAQNPKSVGQFYRRAGGWLHALHESKQITQSKIYPNWMFKSLDVSIEIGPHAPAEKYQPMIDKLRVEAEKFKERRDTRVFSHGDFHAGNLIMGRGVTYGFDFTEVAEKLAIYDIVDFLKIDVLRTGVLDDVDRSGVTQQCKSMFLKLYRHPIDLELLDFCLRGRILKDWIFITGDRYHNSKYQRNKYACLEERLEIAFCR